MATDKESIEIVSEEVVKPKAKPRAKAKPKAKAAPKEVIPEIIEEEIIEADLDEISSRNINFYVSFEHLKPRSFRTTV